jgi:hypothetical protein
MAYLHVLADRGAKTHSLLVDQDAPVVDRARCERASAGIADDLQDTRTSRETTTRPG